MRAIAAAVLRYPVLLALLAGLASATGFAPLDLWPLTLLALALLIHLIRTAPGLTQALLIGWAFGVGHFTTGLNWIATAFTYQAAMPAWLGWIAVLLLSLYLAVYPAIAAGIAWWVTYKLPLPPAGESRGEGTWRLNTPPPEQEEGPHPPTGYAGGPLPLPSRERASLAFTLFFAAAWIVTEYLRATLLTGFAWNPLGAVLVEGAGAARWIGTYGISGIVMLAGGAVAALLQRRRIEGLLLALPLLLSPLAIGAITKSNGPLIRIVQPDIAQQDKWREGFETINFDRLATLTGPPASAPRLVFWPEVAVPDYLEEDPLARQRIATLIGRKDILLTGGIALEYDDKGIATAARNSLFALDAKGTILARADKAHLVPYGEYLPARPILSAIGLSRLAPGDIDFLPGPGPRSIALPGFGKAGIQICYEIIFSGHVVDRANRPDFLFNPSNDAWFGRWGPPQHLAQARLRAIEEGLPVIRATPTGISAVIDAGGRVVASLPWRKAGAIDARLPPPHPPTPFARYGNLLPMLFAGLLVALAIAVRARTR